MENTAETRTVTDDVYHALRDQLVAGKFIQGSKLRAEKLRLAFDCSASTIREVFLRLSCDGFLQATPQRGFRVPRTSPEIRNDLVMVRILLEQQGVSLSIENGDVDWEAEVVACHHRLEKIEKHIQSVNNVVPHLDAWNRAEMAFHQALIAACGSPLLKNTHTNICHRFRMHLMSDDLLYGFRDLNIAEHREIMEAALDRDAPRCSERLAIHINKNLSDHSKYLLASANDRANDRAND